MAGAGPRPGVTPCATRTYDDSVFEVYACRRTTLYYYTHMEDITIACDLCGDQFPYHALGNFGWGNCLMCEDCAQAQADEWDSYAEQKHSMDS